MQNKSTVLFALLSVFKLDELELLLHGLDLGHLTDIMSVSIDYMLEIKCNYVFVSQYVYLEYTMPFSSVRDFRSLIHAKIVSRDVAHRTIE